MNRISIEAVSVIASMEVEGQLAFLTAGQMDRKLYVEVNKALESLGGKWDRKQKAHVFPNDPSEMLDEIALTGQYTNAKQEFGFFETPLELAEELVALGAVQAGMGALEPSAGTGVIAGLLEKQGAAVTVCELQEPNRKILNEKGFRLVPEPDFLKYAATTQDRYDVIVMNPPFARQQDIDHVIAAFNLLKTGGRLVSIMSASVTFRTNRKTTEFLKVVDNYDGSFTPVPEGTFKPSGTNVNTVILNMSKW